MENYIIKVINNEILNHTIDAHITRLEGRYNFKPHIGQLPSGEILMFVAHTHAEERITTHYAIDSPRALASHVVQYRSKDNGRTWEWGRHVPEMTGGHEPSVSIIGNYVFVLTHHFGSGGYPDSAAQRSYPYIKILRSADGGHTFSSLIVDRPYTGAGENERIYCSRNIIKLTDGRLYLGLVIGSQDIAMYSSDEGLSWQLEPVRVPGCSYKNMTRSFFTEALFFHTNSKRLMMLSRVDYDFVVFEHTLEGVPESAGGTGLDNLDGEVLFESHDDGLTWIPVKAIGFPALMYPSIVNLEDNRMLFTYTVREIPPEGTGCIYPKVGVQAVVIEENEDGTIDFDLTRDVMVIDDSTPSSMRNAGCFGNTLLLEDGYFITPFSYPLIDSDILKTADNKGYMDEKTFNFYAEAQSTYNYRYKDFINEDPKLMELYLRRSFSALFLYAQCMNKGGIAAASVRWKI